MKKWIFQTLVITLIVFCGCKDLLDVTPEDKVTGNNFWRNKEQIETAMVGGYGRLQGCLHTFFVWGELRSELVIVTGGPANSPGTIDNRRNVNNNMITQDNGECYWGGVYSTINQFNYVIDFAPSVRAVDRSFTETELDYFLGEAITMRSLCYFYLARTFHSFPYITEASKTDQQRYDYAPIPGTQALDSIVKDLLWAESRVRKDYSDVTFSDVNLRTLYEKGRVTQPFIWALLADVYLTQNKYGEALVYLDKIINSERFSLMVGDRGWYSIFFPGNSAESIFEIQFSRAYENSGNVVRWFSDRGDDRGEQWYNLRRTLRTQTFKYWEGDSRLVPRIDSRGGGGTYITGSSTETSLVWKWSGNRWGGLRNDEQMRNASTNDANWILYRLADVYLMKAEALNRLSRQDEAVEVLTAVRTRVNVTEPVSYANEEELENLILDERAAELAFEGKRWFDLVRIARRQNNNIDLISNRLSESRTMTNIDDALWKARVADPMSWYFPINKSELEKNPNLVQNPYYR